MIEQEDPAPSDMDRAFQIIDARLEATGESLAHVLNQLETELPEGTAAVPMRLAMAALRQKG
ncbi:MAG: hypothetical protein OXE84_14495 [Rhodobacteraceae bacterium]|nr:hypothetical protein [Paracoccaceae bacterium]MCY4326354.1 hypothetical protein [Paracoccaceae bacterium]